MTTDIFKGTALITENHLCELEASCTSKSMIGEDSFNWLLVLLVNTSPFSFIRHSEFESSTTPKMPWSSSQAPFVKKAILLLSDQKELDILVKLSYHNNFNNYMHHNHVKLMQHNAHETVLQDALPFLWNKIANQRKQIGLSGCVADFFGINDNDRKLKSTATAPKLYEVWISTASFRRCKSNNFCQTCDYEQIIARCSGTKKKLAIGVQLFFLNT